MICEVRVGEKFGRLTVIAHPGKSLRADGYRVLCRCECGTETKVRVYKLKSGDSLSCGCYKRERATTHGASRSGRSQWTPEYRVWNSMRTRCRAKGGDPKAKNYAQRGIRICERWNDFAAFLEDMGPKPSPEHSIERRDNNGHYEPGNCYWATLKEQSRNKRSNRILEIDGQRRTVIEWAETTGVRVETIRTRLHAGWSPERAVKTPVLTRATAGEQAA